MTELARDMYAFARRDRYGRVALAVIWVGLLVATCGLAQLHYELSRHPLTEVTP